MTEPNSSLDPEDFILEWDDPDEDVPPITTDEAAVAILMQPPGEGGLSEEESNTLLNSLVAAADTQSGAMIALRPSPADINHIADDPNVDEAPDVLHLTVLYLGAAALIDGGRRDEIIGAAARFAQMGTIKASANGVLVFNPKGDDPCIVLQVGDSAEIVAMRDALFSRIRLILGDALPAQHVPFIPHVTLAYTDDASLVSQLTHLTGPITFDAIRVAFADEVIDIEFENEDET